MPIRRQIEKSRRGEPAFSFCKISSGEDNISAVEENKIGVFEGYMNNLSLQRLVDDLFYIHYNNRFWRKVNP